MALRPCATQGCASSYITKNAIKMQAFFHVFFYIFVFFLSCFKPHIPSVEFGAIHPKNAKSLLNVKIFLCASGDLY